ncbi:MAG: hypothetical protein Tsb009_25680 [Planctomycetaceae bacterium]
MQRFLLAAVLLLPISIAHAADKSQPRSLDPELKIELFAEHPTIVTPTGIDVDYKGRVFAVESNTHFPPAGYKRHPSDRVLVLQDTNGDGKSDKTTVFTDGLTHTMSVKVKPLWLDIAKTKTKPTISLSVYVATRRDIFLYTDTNGDLKADGRKQIIHLETKGNYPHNGLAGIAFDAMGWMYFGFGENLGADYTIIGSDGTKLSGGGEGGNIYRCKPDGSKLTRWATGFWNPHASCVDAFGRLFTVDNDPDSRPPCRLLHIIEGGDYGFRFRNGRKGLHPFTAWNGEIPGTLPMVAGTGEAPSGIVAYESDGLPKKYIGNLLVGSWGDHRIDRFVLKPKGASFVSRAEPIIQGGEDFRPVGLAVAPDGSLFCTDWVKRDYKLHGHGRVWRISRKSRARQEAGNKPPVKRAKVIDLATITPKTPVKELTKLLSHPRLEVRRMAACCWHIRDSKIYEKYGVSFARKHPKQSKELYWAFVRLMSQSESEKIHDIEKKILSKISNESRKLHRRIILQRYDTTFRFTGGLLFWIKYESPSERSLLDEYDFFVRLHGKRTPENTNPVRVRLACVLVARMLKLKSTRLAMRCLKDPSPDVRRIAVQWVAEENLKELKPQVEAVLNGKVMNANLFLATLAALEMLDGKRPQDFDKTPAGKYVLPIVKDAKRSAVVRAQALRLVDPDDPVLTESLITELLSSPNAALKTEAIRTLQIAQRPFAGKLLLKIASDKTVPAKLRADAVAGLAGREFDDPATARTLVGLTKSDEAAVRVEAFRAFRPLLFKTAFGRPARLKFLRKLREEGNIKPGSDESRIAELLASGYREARIRLPNELQSVVASRPKSSADWYKSMAVSSGDASAGRRVFFATNGAGCFRCHTVNGRGGKIGPDLSTIARTMNRRKLAESILEPSREIAPQFTLWSFVMADGKTHHGMILGDTRNGKRQRIGTPQGTIVELPLLDIEERLPQSKSVMPDRLIDRLTVSEFRDLLRFLESLN